jgi:L-lactate dehydrogenase complex protein LldG
MSTAREEILKKLSTSVYPVPEPPDFEQPVFPPVIFPPEQAFKTQLEAINGKVFIFQSETELFNALKTQLQQFHAENVFCSEPEIMKDLVKFEIGFNKYAGDAKNMEAGITGCEFLVAQTGSVMVSSAQGGGRQMNVFPPVHIVIANKNQLVATLEEAYSMIQQKYAEGLPSQIALVTGPSRTADIEKTLVLGAHGPRELRVMIA